MRQSFPDAGEGLLDDAPQGGGGAAMTVQLGRRPALGGVLHQVGRGNYLGAEAAYQFHGAGIHPGHPGQGVAGGVFHRHLGDAGQGIAQGGFQGVAAAIDQGIQAGIGKLAGVHMVGEQARGAPGRHEQENRAGDVAGWGGHLRQDRVGAQVVVNQPAGQPLGLQIFLGIGQRPGSRHGFLP